jgi:hypothetical protein
MLSVRVIILILGYDPQVLTSLGNALKIFASEVASTVTQQILGQTILATIISGLTLPLWLVKLAYLVDNPWSIALDRACKAGELLADSLCENVQQGRPVTLIGFSLGARVIWYCLLELARRGKYGIIEDVYLFGAPILMSRVPKKSFKSKFPDKIDKDSPNQNIYIDDWRSVIGIVGGQLYNCYCESDWVLGYLLRASVAGIYDIAGLSPVVIDEVQSSTTIKVEKDIPLGDVGNKKVVNCDITSLVPGHLSYKAAMPMLIKKICKFECWSDQYEVIEEVVIGPWLSDLDKWWKDEIKRNKGKGRSESTASLIEKNQEVNTDNQETKVSSIHNDFVEIQL